MSKTIEIGDTVRVITTGEATCIDAVVEDARGALYRVREDRWFDARYLEKARAEGQGQ